MIQRTKDGPSKLDPDPVIASPADRTFRFSSPSKKTGVPAEFVGDSGKA